jgi:hypothetical protein
VVVPSDVGNFEGEGLCLDVGFLAKGYREVDLSQRESLIFRNDPVKEGLVLANLGKRDSHCIEGHGIQDAEAASSVHQHLREVHQTHDRGNNHLELSGCKTCSGWSVRLKVMADLDHRRKASKVVLLALTS